MLSVAIMPALHQPYYKITSLYILPASHVDTAASGYDANTQQQFSRI